MNNIVELGRTWQGETKRFVFLWRDKAGTAFSFAIEAHSKEHAQSMLAPDCEVQGEVTTQIEGQSNG